MLKVVICFGRKMKKKYYLNFKCEMLKELIWNFKIVLTTKQQYSIKEYERKNFFFEKFIIAKKP